LVKKKRLTGNILPILTLYSRETVSTYVTSLGKNYDVTSVDNCTFIHVPVRKNNEEVTLTCGVKAKTRSCKEYSLLVLKIPTSRDLRPDSPSFLFRPRKNCQCLQFYTGVSTSTTHHLRSTNF